MLESTFDNQDRFTSQVKDKKPKELEEINLGIEDAPKRYTLVRDYLLD